MSFQDSVVVVGHRGAAGPRVRLHQVVDQGRTLDAHEAVVECVPEIGLGEAPRNHRGNTLSASWASRGSPDA